jgi:hypothetical protein
MTPGGRVDPVGPDGHQDFCSASCGSEAAIGLLLIAQPVQGFQAS